MKKWYNNQIEEKYFEEGTQPAEYVEGRLKKEKLVDKLARIISKEDLFKAYIVDNKSFIEVMKLFNLENRTQLRILLNYYKITKDRKQAAKYTKRTRSHESYIEGGKKSSKTQKDNWNELSIDEQRQIINEREANCNTPEAKLKRTQKYLDWWFSLTDTERDKINSKRSKSCSKAWSNAELIEQQHKTYKENKKNRNCRTKAEQKIYDKLVELNIDFKYDEKIDDRYPYFVDFYIPYLDMFIELEAHPSHGLRPFDINNPKCLEESLTITGEWADTYFRRDPEKYDTALRNKINLIRIYPRISEEENLDLNNHIDDNLIKILYRTQH